MVSCVGVVGAAYSLPPAKELFLKSAACILLFTKLIAASDELLCAGDRTTGRFDNFHETAEGSVNELAVVA